MLRGINVGGHKKVAMADLRTLLTGVGFTDVATLLQSGNAVFNGPEALPEEMAARIERAIADEFSMSVRCMVRTGPELRAVIEGNPFADTATQGSRFLALFLSASPTASSWRGTTLAAWRHRRWNSATASSTSGARRGSWQPRTSTGSWRGTSR
jgi:uncharacterized protein (DUF1697 family)